MSILSLVSLGRKWPQEKPQTMLMQNFGVTNKEYYGMLWYFLEWSNVTQQRIVDDEEIDFEQSLFFSFESHRIILHFRSRRVALRKDCTPS